MQIPRRKILLGVILGALVLWCLLDPMGPSYDGRSLSSWLREFSPQEANEDRTPAIAAIRKMGRRALPELLKELRHKDSAARRKLMEWSFVISDKLERELFRITPAEYRRAAAAEAVRALGPAAAPALAELARNLDDEELANASAHALVGIGSAALPTLIEKAEAPAWPARWAAIGALGQFTNPSEQTIDVLVKAARDPEAEVRKVAADSLRITAQWTDRSVPVLAAMVSDANNSVRVLACVALRRLGSNAAPATAALTNALTNPSLRQAAGAALRSIGPSTIPIFVNLLNDPDPKTRLFASRTIGDFRSAASNHAQALLPLLDDPDWSVRVQASKSLQWLTDDPEVLVTALTKVLPDETEAMERKGLLMLLQKLGPEAVKAVPTLKQLLTEIGGEDRSQILFTLAAIDPEAARQLGADKETLDSARAHHDYLREIYRPRSMPPLNSQPVIPIAPF